MAAKSLIKKNRVLLVLLLAAALIVGGYFVYSHYHKKTGNVIPSKMSNKSSAKGGSSSSSSGQQSQSAKSTPPPAPANGAPPAEPAGPFVSNHTPGQNGAPTTENSVCNTTPGATCYIEFTNGGVTKKLAAQVTNDSGAAIWSWDINDAGLTSGSWKITAIASLNGQSSSATDPVNLEVQ